MAVLERRSPDIVLNISLLSSPQQLAAIRDENISAGFLFNRPREDDTLDGTEVMKTRAVLAVLSGKPPALLPPLDLTKGTAFQQDVWRELQSIVTGQTRSYGQIAAALGRPKACRAVGSACAANPLPLLVPCHRVLAAGGRLGGFSGGLHWKRLLLQVEGA